MPTTFWIIIAFQVIIYIAVYLYKRRTQKYLSVPSVLFVSAIFGFLLGVVFDYLCIYFSTQTYFLEDGSLIPSVSSISFEHLFFNGVLSYGLYVATLYYFQNFSKRDAAKEGSIYIPVILLLLGVVCTYFFIPESIIRTMILLGLFIVSFGEMIAFLFGVYGPIAEVILLRKYKNFLQGYLPSVIVGVLYEVVNYFFPFWIWAPHAHYSMWFIEGMILVFGYYILAHPIIVFWRIFIYQKDKNPVS
jgi:hypothetical protein